MQLERVKTSYCLLYIYQLMSEKIALKSTSTTGHQLGSAKYRVIRFFIPMTVLGRRIFCVVIRFFSSPPQRPLTSDFEGFLLSDPIHYTIFLSYFTRKCPYFPFQCWVLNKGTTGTIFITGWRRPWLGIEPGTSRTRSQVRNKNSKTNKYEHCLKSWTQPYLTLFL